MIDKIPINPNFLPQPEGSFNRAVELNIGKFKILLISGIASVGPDLQTVHPGDFKSQARYTYSNIQQILVSRDFKIKDVVRW